MSRVWGPYKDISANIWDIDWYYMRKAYNIV